MQNQQASGKAVNREHLIRESIRAELQRRQKMQASKQQLAQSLPDFVRSAWSILEPVTPLLWNWHLDLICEYLTLIKENRFKQVFGEAMEGVIFNVPPRTMKSLLITIFWPAWVWTEHPSRRFMFTSYADKLSTQHSTLRRNVIDSPFYRERWGEKVIFARDQNLKTHYENTAKGAMFSTGMKSVATGMGGDCIVFDDPLNPDQALSEVEREAVNVRFDSVFRSRLNDAASGVKVIVMQRLHESDVTGHVLSKEKDLWEVVSLPAEAEGDEQWKFPISGRIVERKAGELLWDKRLPRHVLAGLKRGLGAWAYSGQYQQRPAPLEGGLIKRAWLRFYKILPPKFEFLAQSWDMTFKEAEDTDFVSGQVWGRLAADYYMLPYHVHERLDFGPSKDAVKATHAKYPQCDAVLIEDKANGPAIISELRRTISGVIAVNPEGGKIARGQAMQPLWEAQNVLLPDPEYFDVPWIADYIQIICTFPKCAYDDPFDATSQALIYLRNHAPSFGLTDYLKAQAEKQVYGEPVTLPEPTESQPIEGSQVAVAEEVIPVCSQCQSASLSRGKQFGVVVVTCNSCGSSWEEI